MKYKLWKHPDDYNPHLSPSYRRALAKSDNIANSIILAILLTAVTILIITSIHIQKS